MTEPPRGKGGKIRRNNLWEIRPNTGKVIIATGETCQSIDIDQDYRAIIDYDLNLYLKLKDYEWFVLNGEPVVICAATLEAPWRFEYCSMGELILGEAVDYVTGNHFDCRRKNLVPKGTLPELPKKPFSPTFPLLNFTPSRRNPSPLERQFQRDLKEYEAWQEGVKQHKPMIGIEPTNPWFREKYRGHITY